MYDHQLNKLIPVGRLWESLQDDPTYQRLIQASAEELERIDARALSVIEETDPRTTIELLYEWEQFAGLPDPCLSTPPATIRQRQAALHGRLTDIGGQSRQYYIDIAATIGFVITITEFDVHNVGSSVSDPIYGVAWRFAWQVNAPSVTVVDFDVRGGVNEPLRAWGNEQLECKLTRLKPANTVIIFVYA